MYSTLRTSGLVCLIASLSLAITFISLTPTQSGKRVKERGRLNLIVDNPVWRATAVSSEAFFGWHAVALGSGDGQERWGSSADAPRGFSVLLSWQLEGMYVRRLMGPFWWIPGSHPTGGAADAWNPFAVETRIGR